MISQTSLDRDLICDFYLQFVHSFKAFRSRQKKEMKGIECCKGIFIGEFVKIFVACILRGMRNSAISI